MPKAWATAKYNGDTAGYENWESQVKSALGPLKLHVCLTNAEYQGCDASGARVKPETIAEEDILEGPDTQSSVAMWIAGTLTGTAKTLYDRLCREQEQIAELSKEERLELAKQEDESAETPIPARMCPTAYELFQAIKHNVKPEKSKRIACGMIRDFASTEGTNKLPANVTHDQAVTWYEDKRKLYEDL